MPLLPIIAEQNSGSYFKNLLEKRNQRQPVIKILRAYQRGRLLYDTVIVQMTPNLRYESTLSFPTNNKALPPFQGAQPIVFPSRFTTYHE